MNPEMKLRRYEVYVEQAAGEKGRLDSVAGLESGLGKQGTGCGVRGSGLGVQEPQAKKE